MAKRTDTTRIMQIIDQYLNLLQENGIIFEKVYIYGSYAKGTAHEDSDINLAIVTENWLSDKFDSQFEFNETRE